MPELDWAKFTNLPGAATTNWEQLCGAVVRRSFGAVGSFRYVTQQPGVEFHLRVERASNTLGQPGRWWGWQCRWYDLPSGEQIGTTRRARILEAIRKTEEHVPGTTDWVLWTRRPLTPTDQEWFYNIESTMRLRLWTADDLNSHLVGDAEILRSTYFGDLILTPDSLTSLHEQSIAPIRDRWIPEVHIRVGAENEIRRALGEPEHWPEVEKQLGALTTSIEELDAAVAEVEERHREAIASLVDDLNELRDAFQAIVGALTEREFTTAIRFAASEWSPRLTPAEGRRLARELRRHSHQCAFAVQAGLARQHDSSKLLSRMRRYLSTNVIAVVGPANVGKTHLAVALTSASDTLPCGLYLEAWPLSRRGTVNELVMRLEGIAAKSFVQLLEAVEAAGARAGVRLPVVVDGLNESEDPANWKEELSRLMPILDRLEHVVLIVTLRPPVAEIALPDGVATLELDGFDSSLTEAAVKAYFEEYKIDPGDVHLPFDRFRNPLFLRIFCQATNPDRRTRVTADEVPATLVAAFIRFRSTVVKRIAGSRGGVVRRDEQEILKALDAIALSLWETRRRAMPFGEIRAVIGDGADDWTKSLARALRDEGVLGTASDSADDDRTVILFDAFAGFMIADALVRLRSREQFLGWVSAKNTAVLLGASPKEGGSLASRVRAALPRLIPQRLRRPFLGHRAPRAHPLAPDIRKGLVGLLPRTFPGMQFWQLVGDELREQAIVDAAELEGRFLDDRTVDEIARIALQPRSGSPGWLHRPELVERFREVRGAAGHPLNAEFIDRLLSEFSVADRDLRWTEWIRNSDGDHFRDLDVLAKRWRSRTQRTSEDRLHALWVKWLLTSTVRDLRDVATLALYWYGRGEPGKLFELTLSSLGTDEPYVPERLLAASFGVMMAAPGERREFGHELNDFINGLWMAFCAEDATNPTDHWLIRHHVAGIVDVTRRYWFPSLGVHSGEWRFVRAEELEPIGREDPRNAPRELVYGLDFANYTVGRLAPGRRNYHYEHPEYQEVCSWIRARVWELGWRSELFSQVEERIRERREYPLRRQGRIELYQKKYGWVGFFEAAGRLVAEGRSPIRDGEVHLSDVDIDPSFPAKPLALPPQFAGFMSAEFDDLENWVRGGTVDVPDELLRPDSLGSSQGPWVALSGYLDEEDIDSQRRIFGFIQAALVEREGEQKLRDALASQQHPGSFWGLRLPEAHYVFAGEMTWSACARLGLSAEDLQQPYGEVLSGADDEDQVAIERPAHFYGWESYHSATNNAGGYPVPAVTLAEFFDLRVLPASLDWCDPNGRRASMTFSPPSNVKEAGHLLYFREDLIRDYCARHNYELVWIVWGERDVWFADYSRDVPEWLSQVYADYSNVWRRIASLDEVTSA